MAQKGWFYVRLTGAGPSVRKRRLAAGLTSGKAFHWK
jgi:hypothetical protein